VNMGGLKRWFSPRGQDLVFLLSCIGLLGLRATFDLKQNKAFQTVPSIYRFRHIFYLILSSNISTISDARNYQEPPQFRCQSTYKTPVRQAAEQNRITLESVVPEIFGPDLNSAPRPRHPTLIKTLTTRLNLNTTSTPARHKTP
jgi:hypothetical protein